MTDVALSPFQVAPPLTEDPPVKPAWLWPAAVVGVIGAHAFVAWLMMAVAVPVISSLDSISMDLVPEGDYFEQEEVSAAEDEPPPPEEAEQPDLAMPPPMIVAPETPTLPAQKEVVEQKKKKVVEKKEEVERAKERWEAQAQRRLGSPEGHAQGTGMSQAAYKALLAAAIRRHTPATASIGEGTASVSFHVTSSGGITGISAFGSTPAHAALARRIIGAVHAPPPPEGAFFASQSFHFH